MAKYSGTKRHFAHQVKRSYIDPAFHPFHIRFLSIALPSTYFQHAARQVAIRIAAETGPRAGEGEG